MIVKLLTEHHLEFLSLKGDSRGSSESTLVKMPHCWKSHAAAHLVYMAYARGSYAENVKSCLRTKANPFFQQIIPLCLLNF